MTIARTHRADDGRYILAYIGEVQVCEPDAVHCMSAGRLLKPRRAVAPLPTTRSTLCTRSRSRYLAYILHAMITYRLSPSLSLYLHQARS